MIDLAELRMILAMKRIYHYKYKELTDFDKINYTMDAAVTSDIKNIYIDLSCANGLPNIINGENLANIKESVKN